MPTYEDILNSIKRQSNPQAALNSFNAQYGNSLSLNNNTGVALSQYFMQSGNRIPPDAQLVNTTLPTITKKVVIRKFSKNNTLIEEKQHNIGDTIVLNYNRVSIPNPTPNRKDITITFKSTIGLEKIPNSVIKIFSNNIEGNYQEVKLENEKSIKLSTFENSFENLKIEVDKLGDYIVREIKYQKINRYDTNNYTDSEFNNVKSNSLQLSSNELIQDYIVIFDIIYNEDLLPKVEIDTPKFSVDVDETYINTNQGEDFIVTFYTKNADSFKVTTPTGTNEYLVNEFSTTSKKQILQLNSLSDFGNKLGTANIIITPYSEKVGEGISATLLINFGKDYEYSRLKQIEYEDYVYIPSYSNRDVTTQIKYEYILADYVLVYLNEEDDNNLIYKGNLKGEVNLNYKNLYESGKLTESNPHKVNVIFVPYNVRDTRTIKGDRETFTITFDEAEFTISKETLKEDLFNAIIDNLSLNYEDDSRYLNHIIEVGDDRQILIANWDVDPSKFTNFKIDELGNTIPDGEINNSVVLRLYEELDGQIEIHTPIWISKLMSLPIITDVIVSGYQPMQCPPLRAPNFTADVDFVKSNSLDFASYDEIILSGSKTSEQIVQTYLANNNIDTSKINVDYKSGSIYLWDNFVKYSSAKERTINFRYKKELIEYYSHSVFVLDTHDSSSLLQYKLERETTQKKKDNLIAGFDGFEKFLSTEISASASDKFVATWNSDGSIATYNSTATNWYDNLIVSASLYDKENRNALKNNLPQYVQEDTNYDEFLLFCDMIGQHFDTIHLYIKNMTQIKNISEKDTNGIHDDYLYVYLKQFGWDAKNLGNTNELWKYFFGIDADEIYPTRELDNGKILENGNGFLSGEKATKRVWRRIANNIPYLLKHKGSSRGIKALLSCYGVPESQLSIVEFGGPNDTSVETTKFTYENVTAALKFDTNMHFSMSWNGNVSAVETRFKLNTFDEYDIINGDNFTISLLNSSSYETSSAQYEKWGCLVFSGSGVSVTSSQYPIYDGKWHTLLVQNNNNTTELYIEHADNEFITQTGSLNFTYPSSNWNSGTTIELGYFNGELDEVRLWNQSLSHSVFESHVIGPEMINGNNYNSSTENLLLRLDFERPQNFVSNITINNIAPIDTFQDYVTIFGATPETTYPYNFNVYDRKVVIEIPNSGASRYVNNKVRFEEQTLINDLSATKRATAKQYDQASADSNKLGIFFSPNKDLDLNIAQSFGGISFDNYIGDPSDDNQYEYKTLKAVRNYWFKRIDLNKRNIYDYIKLIRSYDKSLFENIKEMVPARTATNIGLLIAPHMLERSKVDINTKPSVESLYNSGTYEYHQDYDITMNADLYKETFIEANQLLPNFEVSSQLITGSINFNTDKNLETFVQSLEGTITETKKADTFYASNEYYTASIDAGLREPTLLGSIGYQDAQKIVGVGSNFINYGFGNYFTNGYFDYKYYVNGKINHERYKGSLVTTQTKTFTGLYTGSEGKTTFKYSGAKPIFISGSFTELVLQDSSSWSNPLNVGGEFNKQIITNIKTIDGYLPTHYKNVGDLTTGLKNSYYKGSKQTSNTTIDGKSPVEIFVSNPTVLRVNKQGRVSGEPILEVD
jgi:hypothetical protein